jgi:hypothetical protein
MVVQGPNTQKPLTGRQAFMKNWFAMEVREGHAALLHLF